LALLRSRVPHGLKVFLTSVAIVDDLGAIIIIALFYASGLFVPALAAAALLAAALFGLNSAGVVRLAPYLLLGIALWAVMLFSGIHATLAGVIVAMAIPIGTSDDTETSTSPLCRLEDRLGAWVAFLVLPVFGFANAGVSLQGLSVSLLFTPLSLGIAAGLFLGKQAGIMTAVVAMRWTGLAGLPEGVSWRAAYGVAVLCGIGFTMSLFIGLLAFSDPEREVATKVAVLVGSLLSALTGVAVLLGLPRADERHQGE
jgi:NhaA family Na+:H+ antiporter